MAQLLYILAVGRLLGSIEGALFARAAEPFTTQLWGHLPLLAFSIAFGATAAFFFHRSYLLRGLHRRSVAVEIAQRRLKDLERIIPELIIETDGTGRIEFLNDAARQVLFTATGKTRRLTLRQLVVPRDRPAFAAFFAACLAGETPMPGEFQLRLPSGEILPARAFAAPLLAVRDGAVIGMRAVFTDLRGERRFSQALDQRELVEAALTEVLKALTSAGDSEWEQALDTALSSLRPLVAVDRCSLLSVDPRTSAIAWEYAWARPDVAVLAPGEQFVDLRALPWLAEQVCAGKRVVVADLSSLPAAAQVERRRWERLGISSLFAVPVLVSGQVIAMMTFITTSGPAGWGPADLRLLETLCGMIASTWQQRRARREQRAANQQLVDIIEFLPDATFVIDQKGRIVAWNKAMAELTGCSRSDMIGRGDRAYSVPFHGEPVPLLIDHFSDVDLGEYSRNYEFIEMVGDNLYGETFVPFLNGGRGAYLWCTASPLYDGEGRIVGAIESLRDVSYRKRSEMALREGEERYRRLVETLNDGMGIVDAKGRIVFVNDRLCEMTGFSREELTGRHVGEFLPGLGTDADPLDWSGWELPLGEALECDLPCRDGRLMPARVSPSPLHAEDGEFQGGFAVITDMTSIRLAEARYRQLNENLERKVVESTRDLIAANDALRSSEGRFRRIIENLSDGYIFYSLDMRGEFTYISPSYREVLGYGTLEAMAGRFREWYAEPINSEAQMAAERTSLGFKQPPYELRVVHADGTPHVLEILEAPVFDHTGHLTSVEGVMHDVTEERRNLQLVREAQAKLVESEKLAALGGMMAGLSHEINTPIGIGVTASSHLEHLISDCDIRYRRGGLTEKGFEAFIERSRESSGLIHSNLARAADLLENFKQVAVDQSAGQERNVNLSQYLADIIRSLSPRLRNTGFRIRCRCPEDVELHCDPGALYQILSNLVLNSLNHGFAGLLVGEIVINVRRDAGQVVMTYQDNGNGMAAEQLARIYEPFYTTCRGRGGTGLGMHIVYNNVTQTLGGKITCASKPGRGARFTISVPLPAKVEHG